ncbi:MAG: NnrS family protein [Candidatus Eisenbacteria bacterium]|nr:NnrS family protein [Candidatus Eisenbacteria bacterium]
MNIPLNPMPRPAAPPKPAGPEPYRLLFPLGVVYGLAAALVWPLFAAGWIPYPGLLHMQLMIEGFELCFVLGFYLTAMPAFTHAERCRPIELGLAVASAMLLGACAAGGWAAGAHACFTAGVVLLVAATARRTRGNPMQPPEEFQFVYLGLALGLAGGALQVAASTGWLVEPAPRLGLRLASLGMELSMVLGLGSLLVPTFAGMPRPMVIRGIAQPGERAPRRRLYLPLAAAMLLAFVSEALGLPLVGAWLRAASASAVALMVWKIYLLPGRRDATGFSLWGSGWMVVAGLWGAVAFPARAVAFHHAVFIGGFGLITLGIATRVVVTHGGYALTREKRLLGPATALAVLLSLAARLGAEVPLQQSSRAWVMGLGISGALWAVAWVLWSSGAAGPIVRRDPAGPHAPAPPGEPAARVEALPRGATSRLREG